MQNFAIAGSSVLHDRHRLTNRLSHARQVMARGGFSEVHAEHRIDA